MDFFETLKYFEKIYSALMDDESKKLFKARVNLMRNGDEEEFFETIVKMYNEGYCGQVEEYLQAMPSDGIVIYGCGYEGRKNKAILDKCKQNVSCYCDSDRNKVGTTIDGLNVISREELLEKYRNYLVIISSRKYFNEIYAGLLKDNFPKDRLMRPMFGILFAGRGNQYFDVFEPAEKEWFIDAGSYNGDTMLDFCEWAGKKYAGGVLWSR